MPFWTNFLIRISDNLWREQRCLVCVHDRFLGLLCLYYEALAQRSLMSTLSTTLNTMHCIWHSTIIFSKYDCIITLDIFPLLKHHSCYLVPGDLLFPAFVNLGICFCCGVVGIWSITRKSITCVRTIYTLATPVITHAAAIETSVYFRCLDENANLAKPP